MLLSLEGIAQTLIVNENSQQGDTENLRVLQSSIFAQQGRLILDRTAFVDFAYARNRCLELHRLHHAGEWVAFVDADEVHTPQGARIAASLPRLSLEISRVDGYTRHFFQSPIGIFLLSVV